MSGNREQCVAKSNKSLNNMRESYPYNKKNNGWDLHDSRFDKLLYDTCVEVEIKAGLLQVERVKNNGWDLHDSRFDKLLYDTCVEVEIKAGLLQVERGNKRKCPERHIEPSTSGVQDFAVKSSVCTPEPNRVDQGNVESSISKKRKSDEVMIERVLRDLQDDYTSGLKAIAEAVNKIGENRRNHYQPKPKRTSVPWFHYLKFDH